MANLDINLFGAFEVFLNKEPVESFISDKSRALLAYLAVESQRPHRRDHLAGILWPNQPEKKALHNLRQALSSLRKTLQDQKQENQYIIVNRDSIQFNKNSDHELDIRIFNGLIAKAFEFYNRNDGASRIHFRALKQALALYKGHFLDQFYLKESVYFEEWSMLQREVLSRKVLEVLNCLVEYYERQGNYHQALQCASRMVELAPWEEHAHRIVMLQLALNGQWSAAADQYHSLKRYLNQEIGLEPTAETVQLYEEIRSASAKGKSFEPRFLPTINQLPSFSNPFIGRQKELDEISDLLANPHCRLLTIMGPGGVGKTRLAIEAAYEQTGLFQDGVYYVSLGDIQNEINIIPRIAEGVSFNFSDQGTPKSQLQKYLHNKKILLILDNFEHLTVHANLISELLNSTPGLVVIVTTRERLKLKEEWIFTLDGLSFPRTGGYFENRKKFDAINLFEVCAQQVNRDFKITSSEIEAIIQICRLVEGNPLAVEMAASSTYTKSCLEIAEQLANNYEFLSTTLRNVQPRRQRSMLATMHYSWDLLSGEEKDVFSQLSIFLEYFDTDAAFTILGIDSKMLATFISKSLIRRTSDERYILHRLLRQFVWQKLVENNSKRRTVEERYCNYYVNLLSMQASKLDGHEQLQALIEINQNIDNYRKTWALLISHTRFSDLEQIVDAIYRFHIIRSHFNECIALFKDALSALASSNNHENLTHKILARQGVLYQRLGNYALAKKYIETGLSTFRCHNKTKEIIFCLVQLGSTYFKLGHYEEVKSTAIEALELATSIEDQWGITSSYYLSGYAAYRLGDIKTGKKYLEKSLDISRVSDMPRLSLDPLNALGDIACHQGEYAEAIQIYKECLQLSIEIGDEYRVGIHYNNLGTVFHTLEQFHKAESYYLESLHICEKIGDLVGQAIALSNLGEIKLIQNQYPESRNLFHRGLGIGRELDDHWSILACLRNLGLISLMQDDLVNAKIYYTEGFKTGIKHQTIPQVLNMLLDLAEYLSNNGNLDLAAEMLFLIINHPSSEHVAREKANLILGRNFDVVNYIDPRPINILIENGLIEISKK